MDLFCARGNYNAVSFVMVCVSHPNRKGNHVMIFSLVFCSYSLYNNSSHKFKPPGLQLSSMRTSPKSNSVCTKNQLHRKLFTAISVRSIAFAFYQILSHEIRKAWCTLCPGQITNTGCLISITEILCVYASWAYLCWSIWSNTSITLNMFMWSSKKIIRNEPVEKHLSKACWSTVNCLRTATCFDLAWNSNQAWHDWILTCNEKQANLLHIKILWYKRESVVIFAVT